ncbi:hypothetical protein NIES2100_73840 [Calothrix sp. NIES-2100]|uniref:tape measure protein n=1 Tax=Calothrix sp. NIES-2100 TaxID=1954172 RepID=UPI000B5EF8CE|nr:hypothetical protein NIES2100_73840 [Calothrix sp. NIES-2100]
MDYGQLVVELVGDYSKLKRDLENAKQQALKDAQDLERIYRLSPSLNTEQLKRDVQFLGLESGRSLAKNLQQGLNNQKISLTNVTIDAKSLKKVGVEVGAGLAEGIRQSNSQARKAAADLAVVTIDETRRKLKIHSPSQVFKEIGENIVQGLASGLATGGTLAVGSLINGVIDTAKNAVDKAFEFTGDSINKYANQKAVTAQLSIQLGDTKAAQNSLKFVREESDRLGFSLENSQKQFASLVSNAKGSKLSLEQLKEVYSAFNTLGRINQLSNDDLKGVFTGLEQSFSKGKLQAEELRGQIAERLPGALAIVSKALGVTQAQLDKLLSSGQLKPDQVWLLFAREVQKEYGGKLTDSLNNSTVGFTKLSNTIYELQTSLGEAVEPAVISGLTFITDVVKQLGEAGLFNDLNQGAQQFSEYLKQNPQIAKETADIISNALKTSLNYVVTLSSNLLGYLKQHPDAIAQSVDTMKSFADKIIVATQAAWKLVEPFAKLAGFIAESESRLQQAQKNVSESKQGLSLFDDGQPLGAVGGLLPFLRTPGRNSASTATTNATGSPTSPYGTISPIPGMTSSGGGGYPEDTGLDILSKLGSTVVAAKSGTLIYAEQGHNRQQNQDSDPSTPGFQPSHSALVKLDEPITYKGKKYSYMWYTHMRSLNPEIANRGTDKGQAIRIPQGMQLGEVGVANNVSHLHFGIVGDRNQRQYLNYKEVQDVLYNGLSNARTVTRPQLPTRPTAPNINPADGWMRTKVSYYGGGDGFDNSPTASGERFDARKLTAAINENLKRNLGLKWGDRVEVVNPKTNQTVVVRINDHGPYEPVKPGQKPIPHHERGFDLSAAAAAQLGITNEGVANIIFRVLGKNPKTITQNVPKTTSNSTIPTPNSVSNSGELGQRPANIDAILRQQDEENKIKRRNAIRQSQDLARSNAKTVSDAIYSSNLNPTQDERNVRAAQEKLRQLDDQILVIQRKKEDAQSRININQNKVKSGSLTEDELADTKQALDLDFKLIKQLDTSLTQLTATRKKTSDVYAEFNDRDRKFRLQASDLRLDQQQNETLEKKITGLRELQNINPYAKELEALPKLERELALRQEQLKLNQSLLELEQSYSKGEIDSAEYSVRLDNLEKLNAAEVRNIDIRYKAAQAAEQQRTSTLELNKVLRELGDISDDLKLKSQLREYGIGDGDRYEIDRDSALVDANSKYLQDAAQLTERARLEQFTPEQLTGERIRQAIRDNQRRSLINAQYDRQISDRDFNSGSKVSESLQNLLSAQVEQRQGLGLDARPLQKQTAILGQNLDFRNQIRGLEDLFRKGDITADAFDVIRENLTALNQVKLQSINNEFNQFSDVIKGVKADTQNVFKDFILGTEDFGSSISKIFQSILNNLADMASQMLSDQLFGSIFGVGQTPDFGENLFGDLFGGLFANGGEIPNYASGGLVGSIADAMSKERSLTGRQPHLIVASEGERVLSADENKQWHRIQSSGRLPNFASGGEVGMSSGISRIAIAGSGDSINAPVTVTVNGGNSESMNIPMFQKLMENKIQAVIREERRPGGTLSNTRSEMYGR